VAQAHAATAKLERRTVTMLAEAAARLDESGVPDWAATLTMLAAELAADAALHEEIAVACFDPTPPPGPLPHPTARYPVAR
jgi:hypothetical protein